VLVGTSFVVFSQHHVVQLSQYCVLTGHPFDLTKTRLQTAGPGQYTGALDVVKKTLARDGVKGCVVFLSSHCVCTITDVG
jgi:Mitochondrial carrier protein